MVHMGTHVATEVTLFTITVVSILSQIQFPQFPPGRVTSSYKLQTSDCPSWFVCVDPPKNEQTLNKDKNLFPIIYALQHFIKHYQINVHKT